MDEITEIPEERQDEELVPEKPDYENEILSIIRTVTSPRVLRDRLSDYHSNDIADALEHLSPAEREKLYKMLDTENLTSILEYLDEEEQAKYLDEMNIKKVISILNEMEADKAADLLKELGKEKRDIILELLEPEARRNISMIFSYDEDEIGSKMTTNYVVIPRGISIKNAMRRLIEQAPENDNITTIYVLDENNVYYGAINLRDLIVARQGTDLEDIITTSYPYLYANEPINVVVEELKDYNEDSIPILNNDNLLLGVITAQDLLEVMDEEMGEDYAMLAGLSAEEDLEEPLFQSMGKRLPWLLVLLFLGLVVSSVVSLFESVVAKLTLIMAFQSLILGMSGNVGTQSLAVTIRVLMDDSLTGRQRLSLVFKEIKVGFLNGLIVGSLSFVILGFYIHLTKGFDWAQGFAVSGCIGMALLMSMTISSFTGTTVPMLF